MTHPENPERRNGITWLRSQLTVQNFVLAALLVSSAGGWMRTREQTDESLITRVAAAERSQDELRTEIAGTYVRRDVLEERLKAIEASLREIKVRLELLDPQRTGK